MPYIKQNERDKINAAFQREMEGYKIGVEPRGRWDLVAATMTPGELNYLLTNFILAYFTYSPNYQRINDVLGVLDAVGKEFYRRVVADFEDYKCDKNGDVYLL